MLYLKYMKKVFIKTNEFLREFLKIGVKETKGLCKV